MKKRSEINKIIPVMLIAFLIFLIGIIFVHALTFVDNDSTDFNSGTYNFTFYNSSGFVQLNQSRLNGTYTSQIFNAGSTSQWNNISWTSNAIGELPNNGVTETNFGSGNFNMTGNVGLWHLNEASGTIIDYSGNGNNGTQQGGVTYSASGKLNTAIGFDGVNDGINVSNSASLNPSSAMTISAWIYINTGNANYGAILTRWGTGGNAYFIGTNPSSSQVAVYFSGSLIYTTPSLSTNQWIHLLVTHNGSTVSAYNNGAYLGGGNSGSITSSTAPSSIGYDTNRVNYPFNGSIDEFAIWNRSLSATEILNIYKRGALRLNLSVQSCNDAACSGESFTNLGANLTSPQNLNVANNTFFQYKFEFETDNVSYTPELYNITIDYTILDSTPPSITLNAPNNGINTSSQNLTFNFTATDETSTTLNCSLYIDSSFKMNNATTLNNTLTNLNASNIAGGSHNWSVTCIDVAGNSNSSSNRSFYVDLIAPNITFLVYTPNSTSNVDPGSTLTFNASISDDIVKVSSVILQYHNGTAWLNSSMSNSTVSDFNTTITLATINLTYSFNIWANDSLGNSNQSSNQTFDSVWDCTWWSTSTFGQVAGFDENKWIGNITVNNTGDVSYASSNCSLDVRLTYNLAEGRVYYDDEYVKNVKFYTLAANANTTIRINASFQGEILEESLVITLDEFRGRSDSRYRNTTATLISTTGGPYLYQEITSNPTSMDLTFKNFSLESYVRNIVGDDTVNNTAFNVTFNWTLPSGFLVKDGQTNLSYGNLSNNSLRYNNINVTFNATNLPSLKPGTFTIYLYAKGFNSSGTVITHAENRTLLTESFNLTLSCYGTSDGVHVSACGDLDPDPASASSGSSGGGGGGGSGGIIRTESVRTSSNLQLVRGEENEIKIVFKNTDKNESITNIEFSVKGKISKYIDFFPKTLLSLGPGEEIILTLKIVSPTYIEIGKQEIDVYMNGKKGTKNYVEQKKVVLEIHELSEKKARALLEESIEFMEKFRKANFTSDELEKLLNESLRVIEEFDYETVRDNYEIIKETVTNALGAKEIIEELASLISEAGKKGIDVSGAQRILKLAELSLQRGDFEQAYLRAKEAQVTYALEVKGEFGSLNYYIKTYPKEISYAILFLAMFSFTTYKIARLQKLKHKIKNLKEEELILHELIKVVQNETFNEKKMSMEEYREAMEQYEQKLSNAIEQLIKLETERAHLLRFTRKQKLLRIERERIIEMIKQVQKDYLEEKKIETRTYELKLESYNKRLSEIDQAIATFEAKSAMKRRFGLFGRNKIKNEGVLAGR